MRFQDLYAYKKSVVLAMQLFEVSKSFPKEETYSLTSQIRRCSRSVSANIAEAYRKRAYPKHFFSKLTDSDAENSETQVWLEFSLNCNYIEQADHDFFFAQTEEIGKLINFMMRNPSKFGVQQ